MGELALVRPRLWLPTRHGLELLWDELEPAHRRIWERVLGVESLREKVGVLAMAGSDANYASKALADLLLGKTAYAGETTIYGALYTAALDDTFNGATANEAGYTSYARLALTNNTTIFAAGSGSTTYTKSFPADAAKSWPASSGGATPACTYLGWLNGNAGTSADKGIGWCSITSVTINNGDTPQLAQNAASRVAD